MKKKIGLLLATFMVLNTVSATTFAWESPLKKYNLYDDVTNGGNSGNDSVERVMDEYNANSLRSSQGKTSASVASLPDLNYDNLSGSDGIDENSRNETLRKSSKNVYSDPESKPGWLEGPSFYPDPSFESIKAKYKKSDFAGCLQECISYVRKNPNDTLGFYYLAMCYTKVSDKENAVKAYEKVIALNSNPMIVKYATNGRNCVMDNNNEKCYENVNEPELVYPYANIAKSMDLTPVDPETLVNRNLSALKSRLNPAEMNKDNNSSNDKDNKDNKNSGISIPFGKQDDDLDKFINSPYGNGLSPDLNKEYKQLQLRKIQQSINTGDDNAEKENREMDAIKKFDKQKSDSGLAKLAMAIPDNAMEELSRDPDFIRQKQEMDELHALLGNGEAKDNMTDLLPYMTESGSKNLSPEVIQALMMKSVMGDLTL